MATRIQARREIHAETSRDAALNTHGVEKKQRRFEPHNTAFQLGEISQQKLIETAGEIERAVPTSSPPRPT
jgi:hypothetical protein